MTQDTAAYFAFKEVCALRGAIKYLPGHEKTHISLSQKEKKKSGKTCAHLEHPPFFSQLCLIRFDEKNSCSKSNHT